MQDIYWGGTLVKRPDAPVTGGIVEIEGEQYYRVENYDAMTPFLMSVVSGSDHWLYVSSNGGLTCGRGNPDNALFPYETDDRVHASHAHTGPQTCLLVDVADKRYLWQPFGDDVGVYDTRRNLYKNLVGNRLIFEEINHDLGLVFTYGWSSSAQFGFVKTTTLRNLGGDAVAVKVLDGLRNLLPAGIGQDMQTRMSTLADAYKRAETDASSRVGIFSLTSIPNDHTEPCESLRASVAWCLGLEKPRVLLSTKQVEAFCAGHEVTPETLVSGQRCSYFVQSEFNVAADETMDWRLVADVDQGPSDLPLLLDRINGGINCSEIDADIEACTRHLRSLVERADGCQVTSDGLVSGRHFANTLFNIMRGGVFLDDYNIQRDDFLDFVSGWNLPLRDKFKTLLASRTDPLTRAALLEAVESSGDADMQRLVLEYLPLCFSRRHGDPSRPWNKFNIDIRNPDGGARLYYQGNWRDIFQNWEALAISYPEFIDSFIAKFVNASTVDGYNPYRISRDGIDWEVPDPEDAWANIGYWGDHQAAYLLRFLEFSQQYHPGNFTQTLDRDLFVYAAVPYRLKDYPALLENPRDSIEFDHERAREIDRRVEEVGADGKLVTLGDGSIYRVNLVEKLLVTVLAKLGSFVPGGGIWMNTQRPEWNDANNALAGFGLSVVTLGYLRRLLISIAKSLEKSTAGTFSISVEVERFFRAVEGMLDRSRDELAETASDTGRKAFMDEMGAYAQDYREQVYAGFSGVKSEVRTEVLLDFVDSALDHLDHTLGLSRRPDGLFRSYNLIHFGGAGFTVTPLPEMLEGQVALLNSGYLQPRDGLALLDALRDSRLYRADQHSYTLYPNASLPPFLDKNIIPKSLVANSPLLIDELDSGRRDIIEQDIDGRVHFNGAFANVAALRAVIDRLDDLSDAARAQWCEVFDDVFKHREFTGRSGTMHKYEGLGCIYWHMVSKLVLAVAEFIIEGRNAGADESILERLTAHFRDIREGLGLHKTPEEYGAIPLDPYSHTPGFTGVQQPGMTGQVKEDIITRFRELGVVVEDGAVSFNPYLLSRDEFTAKPHSLDCLPGDSGQAETLAAGCLAFSLCGTPVIYRLGESYCVQVHMVGQETVTIAGPRLNKPLSRSLFNRDQRIKNIVVHIPKEALR